MNNTILIDSSMNYLYRNTSKKTSAVSAGNSYLDILKALQSSDTPEEEVSTADMTMDEYKEYIGGKMQQLSRHSTRSDSTASVIISNDGWKKMKSDPAYEAWVLNTVQGNLSKPDPWASLGSSSYAVYRFGATMDEYQEDTWGKDYPGDVKSYLTSELFGPNSSMSLESFWLKLARKKQQAANQQAMQELTNSISRLQQLNLLKTGNAASAELQNSVTLAKALTAYTR